MANHEQLSKAAHKLDKRSKRDRRDLDKQARQKARIESRLQSFETLRNRNRSVVDRASKLVEAATDGQPELLECQRACVVLGQVPTMPGTTLIAQITVWHESRQRGVQFEFYKAKRPSFAFEVGENPSAYFLRPEIAIHTEKLRDRDEASYDVHEEGEDEVTKLALGAITGKVLGGRGGNQHGKIQTHVENLESTMYILDEAARNETLNPVLSGRLDEIERLEKIPTLT